MSEFTIDAATLRRAFNTALAFAHTDETFPALTCLNFKPVKGGVEIAATDRYVLSWETVEADGTPFDLLIPTHIVKRLLTMMPKGTARRPVMGAVSFTQDGDRVAVRFVGELVEFETEIAFNLPDFKGFPDYQKMLDGFEEIDPKDFVHEVHLNPHFMARVSKAIAARGSGEPLGVRLRTSMKPIQLTTPDGFNAIVMPVRMNASAS